MAGSLVKETMANIKEIDSWVAGYGWDPSPVAQHCDLDIDLLDAWSWTTINDEQVSVPTLIINQSGHLASYNNAAREKAQIIRAPGTRTSSGKTANPLASWSKLV